jgi:peptidoglycan/LPS O-acetylase OafA/YrhL
MAWIILGHAFFTTMVSVLANPDPESFNTVARRFLFTFVPGAFYAVDIFFFLSSFLGVYLMLEKLYPKRGKMNYGLLYFHRFYRLLPPVLMLMGFV